MNVTVRRSAPRFTSASRSASCCNPPSLIVYATNSGIRWQQIHQTSYFRFSSCEYVHYTTGSQQWCINIIYRLQCVSKNRLYVAKIISKRCEFVKLCHISRGGPVFFDTVYTHNINRGLIIVVCWVLIVKSCSSGVAAMAGRSTKIR